MIQNKLLLFFSDFVRFNKLIFLTIISVFRYFEELCELKRRAGKALLTWNDLQTGLNTINTTAHGEHERQFITHVILK